MAKQDGDRLRVRAMLGDYANTQALKSGTVASGRLVFDFDDVKLPQTAFKAVVRGDYDVAELVPYIDWTASSARRSRMPFIASLAS